MFGIIAAGLGIGLQAFGVLNQYQGAKSQAQAAGKEFAAQKEIAGREKDIEAQRRQAMELDFRRKQLEIVRNMQRSRAMALQAATSQGASMGSGLQGGYGQISGDAGTNLLGASQNVGIGRNIFGLNDLISQQKMNISDARTQMAQAGTQTAFGQGISSLGSSLLGSTQTIKSLSGFIPR